ncbi:MAG: hypothetical protein U0T81_17955 [Saprospiraceae bacterium]
MKKILLKNYMPLKIKMERIILWLCRSKALKFAFTILFLFLIHNRSFTQGVIIFNAETLELNEENVTFKVGKIIAIKVTYYDPGRESLKFEISYSDVQNIEGIKRFNEATSRDLKIASPATYFLSFKIEDKDYTHIKVKRLDAKGEIIEERLYSFRNRGGIKFDVSTGFFATNLKDKSYLLAYVNDTVRQIIKEKNGNFRGELGYLRICTVAVEVGLMSVVLLDLAWMEMRRCLTWWNGNFIWQ